MNGKPADAFARLLGADVTAPKAAAAAYAPEIAAALCDLVVDENLTLSEAARRLGVSRRTVRSWLARNADFAAEYDAAHKMRLDQLADEVTDLIDAADGSSQSEVTKARAQVDARKWILAKSLPHRFGDSLALTGADGKDLIPADDRARRLPALVNVLALLAPDKPNGELLNLATALLDRASGSAVTLPKE